MRIRVHSSFSAPVRSRSRIATNACANCTNVWRSSAQQQIVLIILAIIAAVLATAPLELQRHIINTLAGHEKACAGLTSPDEAMRYSPATSPKKREIHAALRSPPCGYESGPRLLNPPIS
jgi:hypothetical protein